MLWRRPKKEKKLDSFIKDRLLENKKLFTHKEMKFIEKNKKLVKKIYLLGVKNAKDLYDENQKKP